MKEFRIFTDHGWKEIKGREIKLSIAPEYRFFLNRMIDNPNLFVVSEYYTGQQVSLPHRKSRDAIQSAEKNVERYKTIFEQKVKEAMEE